MSAINAINRVFGPWARRGADDRLVTPPPAQGQIELDANRHLHLRDARGARIEALSGALWITQSGDIRDIVLEAGDAIVFDRDEEVVISALSNATLRVAPLLDQSADQVPAAWRPPSRPPACGDAVPA